MLSQAFDTNKTLRYSRQIILDEIGCAGQEKLMKSKVLVAGAGGLGSPALLYLAAAGVGNLGIADFDTVGISNLNRQVLHSTDDLGKKKTESAYEKIKKLNPDVNVVKYPFRLDIDNVEEIVSEYDVVIDAMDNFPARYLLSDCCYLMRKPLVEGAAVGYEAILMTITPGNSPCYRCLYPYPPEDGVVQNCSDTGILGMVTGTIGSLQALEALKVILGIGQTLTGRLLIFNGLDLTFRTIDLKRKDNCPLCGTNPKIIEIAEYSIKCVNKAKTYKE